MLCECSRVFQAGPHSLLRVEGEEPMDGHILIPLEGGGTFKIAPSLLCEYRLRASLKD